MKRFGVVFLIVATGVVLGAGNSADGILADATASPPPPVVTKFLGLFDRLRAEDEKKAQGTRQHVSFRLSDSEIDDYLRYSLHAIPRPGLNSVTVKIFPANYISTFTVIDFDAVERWHPGTIPVLLRPMLSGKKSIWIDYRINANDSRLSFSVEKAYYDSLRLPALFVEKMIALVAARQPEKYDTSKPIPLPFGLRQMWTTDHAIHGQN